MCYIRVVLLYIKLFTFDNDEHVNKQASAGNCYDDSPVPHDSIVKIVLAV